ncbi:hypothetical protein C2845_PM08G15410 [Panicum miliaceum]|uniref:Uncharacterized protein n=1 Tax=Panicum miliaceum TaxID=4540 RepID=A0A3L6QXR5_PANMI|nr:hypothetical protein C2845_PM08G15410 [Panicum miliaceum]
MGSTDESKARLLAHITNISVIGTDWLHTNHSSGGRAVERPLDTINVETGATSQCDWTCTEECTTPQVTHGAIDPNTPVTCDNSNRVEEPPVNLEHVEHKPHVTPGVRHNLLAQENRHFQETVGRKKNARVVEDYGTQATPPGSTVVDQEPNMVSLISAEPDIQRMGGKVSENHKLRLQPDGINNGNVIDKA